MHLIIGLGNPGKEYEKTRHNVGFMILDNLSHCAPSPSPLPSGERIEVRGDWKFEKKLKAEISKGEIDGEKAILAKPQTFMNNSGEAIKNILTQYSLSEARRAKSKGGLRQAQAILLNNLWIVHDDIDLSLGKIKISFGSGSAGHNGVQSIIDALGTKDFWRLRIGIGPQKGKSESFVLKHFSKEEQKILKDVIERAGEALSLALKNPEKAMNQFN